MTRQRDGFDWYAAAGFTLSVLGATVITILAIVGLVTILT